MIRLYLRNLLHDQLIRAADETSKRVRKVEYMRGVRDCDVVIDVTFAHCAKRNFLPH